VVVEMKKLILMLTLLTALAVPALASASPANIGIPTNCNGPASTLLIKPGHIWLSCDSTFDLAKLHWHSWTESGAVATGVAAVKNCDPDCASGELTDHAATVRLSRPRLEQGYEVYTHLRVTARGLHPLTQTVGYANGGWSS
jgi:hypothetical protein